MQLESYGRVRKKLASVFYVIVGLSILSCVYFIQIFFESGVPPFEVTPKKGMFTPPLSFHHFDFGPLSIARNENKLPLPNIEGQISIISINDRPDIAASGEEFLIYLKNTKQKKAMRVGQRAYLSFKESEDVDLKFDVIPSPLWLRLEKGEALPILQIGFDLIDETGERLIANKQNVKPVLQPKTTEFSEIEDPFLVSFVTLLKGAKYYLPDKLYEVYADDDPLSCKFRLSLPSLSNKEMLFIQEGDLFYLAQDGALLDGKDKHPHLPIAKIEEINPSFLCIKLWDKSGLEKCILKLEIEEPSPFECRAEEAFKRLRKRSATTASCLIGAKRVELKNGDWVLHHKLGWKVLRAPSEMLDCVHYKLEGDLFVFDGVKKEDGSYYFHGWFFDKTRSSALKVCLPLTENKNKGHSEVQPALDASQDADDILNSSPPLETGTDLMTEFDYFDFDF